MTAPSHKDYPFDENDPNTFWGAYSRDVWNNGESGAIPGWKESRYFTEYESYEKYLAAKGDMTTPDALTKWFEPGGGYSGTGDGYAWDHMNQDEHDLQVKRAKERIQHTYEGLPPSEYPTISGKERYEGEKELGVEHGSLY